MVTLLLFHQHFRSTFTLTACETTHSLHVNDLRCKQEDSTVESVHFI